jgi:hypothetical protein
MTRSIHAAGTPNRREASATKGRQRATGSTLGKGRDGADGPRRAAFRGRTAGAGEP